MKSFDVVRAAADNIERHSELYDFDRVGSPNLACGTPACAVGWIRFCAGIASWVDDNASWTLDETIRNVLHIGIEPHCFAHQAIFYSRMDELEAELPATETLTWRIDPMMCAALLRTYADRYLNDGREVRNV